MQALRTPAVNICAALLQRASHSAGAGRFFALFVTEKRPASGEVSFEGRPFDGQPIEGMS